MDFHNNTPAERFFQDDVFELRRNSAENVFDGASLSMRFSVAELTLDLEAFDYEKNTETHVLRGSTDEHLHNFIREVEAAYQVRIPQHFINLSQWFLRGKVTGFKLEDVYLGDPDDEEQVFECETCNDYNTNAVTAYFFPSFRNVAPSIAAIWDYGCFNGEREAGEYTQVTRNKVVELLTRAGDATDNAASKKEITRFVKKLEGINFV